MKRLSPLLLATLSGLLLSLAWQVHFTVVIFIALVPLFILDEKITESSTTKRKKLRLIGLLLLAFFIWNLLTTWWIYFALPEGAVMAIVANSLLMCATYMLWQNAKKRINKPWGIWLFVPIWLGFEYLHSTWDISWPWLTLGNAFAFQNTWVQWYEYTGTSGGSIWIIVVNILLFKLFQDSSLPKKEMIKKVTVLLSIVLVPILLSSLFLISSDKGKPGMVDVVVVQPNVDPYNEKFLYEPSIQLQALLNQIEGKLDSSVDYLVLPETFLTEDIWESNIEQSYSIQFLRTNIINKFPQLKIVSGANTLYAYKPTEKPSATARVFSDGGGYYDYFNSAIQIDSTKNIQIYHKSKLVPGAEKMPWPKLFKPLEKLAIDLGGTTGSLGMQEERAILSSSDSSVKIAPVICYESIYGEYVTDYILKGANLMCIVTNDGWWQDTPGHRHHLAYGALRAIETRRAIARSANTGTSCFIDKYGAVTDATEWWTKAVIRQRIELNSEITFYVKFGDILSKTSSILALCIILLSQILRFRRK